MFKPLSLAGLALLLFGPFAHSQRLPQTVKPVHYDLRLTPDLKAATFTGQESIDVTLTSPAATITLNSAEIKFQSVTASVNGKMLTAKITTDEAKQQATFDFGQQLPVGKLKLKIDYTGILNNELRGFYLSKTVKRNYAVTQFESTDARRAFPSFDEPAFKATFSVTLVVDKNDTAISNTNIVHDVAEPAAKHAITFAPTPKMSTYLLAFLVGDFKCLNGSSDGTPIRVCATPDQVQYGKFALEATEYTLHYYNTYFGIKYPMPKLDMIALPDFEAGAMENFGAITYRETDLLLDSAHASVNAQRNVALVVAHEMAHQWFGDMVTMQWWDNIWLNEGFATWMENKPVEAWKPEWNIPEEVALGNQDTLDLDAEKTTRTIRAKAETPDEINEMFDGISYGKAGAVLLMVEHYLGKETFRQGVHNYLAAHLFSNATAEDFWFAQTATSHKPIDKIMDSFVSQPGEPLLVLDAANSVNISITQHRFFLNANNKSEGAEAWTLPICFKLGAQAKCKVLSDAKQKLPAPSSTYLFANASGKGYYRTSYPADMFHAILPHVESGLTTEERISLLGDQWALTRADSATVASYLDLISTVKNDTTPEVIQAVTDSLRTIGNRIVATSEERTQFAAWIAREFAPALKATGDPQASDTPAKRELRANLLLLVAGLGNDSAAIAEAKAITERGLADTASVDQTLFTVAINIAAANGDAALFEKQQKLSLDAPNPQQRGLALRGLEHFIDPVLETRALEFAVSGQVRNQDVAGFLSVELRNVETRELAWKFMQQNWEKVAAQLTTSSGAYIVGATGNFCSADKRDEVSTFFTSHKVAAAERTLKISTDQINDCISLRSAQEPNLKSWLSKQ